VSARLRFVGSGDAFAGGGRFQTCLHVEADGTEPLLLDCGATTLIALKRLGIDPASIGYVALTHLHGDHFGGLPWLILDGQFANRTKRLEILGPFETHITEYAAGPSQEFGPARITAYPVRHTPGTNPHGLRVEYADRVIAFSGDTEWADTLPEIARGADLFVCECNFFDTRAPGHLNYQTLMERREQLECERIVITHMSADMIARVDAGEIEFEAAADGAVISF
jgi:ribonuclease BN (tRNA processing enzyme)